MVTIERHGLAAKSSAGRPQSSSFPAGSIAPPPTRITLAARCDADEITADAMSMRTIEWTVSAAECTTVRMPVNAALVFIGDSAHFPVEQVQHALIHALAKCNSLDDVTLIAGRGSETAAWPFPADISRVTDARVTRCELDSPCLLFDGWQRGYAQVSSKQSTAGINRILLVTMGSTAMRTEEMDWLLSLVKQQVRLGVSTSTFGMGVEFNEFLLEQIAEAGEGHYYFAGDAAELAECLCRELVEMQQTSARETTLTIAMPGGVTIETAGCLPVERHIGHLHIHLGDLAAGEQRVLFTRATLPSTPAETTITLYAYLSYVTPMHHAGGMTSTALLFHAVPQTKRDGAVIDFDIFRGVNEMDAAGLLMQALYLAQSPDASTAWYEVEQALHTAAPYLSHSMQVICQEFCRALHQELPEEFRKRIHQQIYTRLCGRTQPPMAIFPELPIANPGMNRPSSERKQSASTGRATSR